MLNRTREYLLCNICNFIGLETNVSRTIEIY